MTTVYNGFQPDEARVRTYATNPADDGHSLVAASTRRRGNRFEFFYTYRCECGRRYSSRQDQQRAYRSFEAHQRRAQEGE